MADTKISALTAGAPALGTDELPVARSGANRKLLVSDLATYIGTNNVLSQTVAQAQTNNGSYTKGSWVQVTEDIGGITGTANSIFPVIEGGVLAGTGWCRTFQNSGMAATRMVEIDWDVTSEFVSRIKELKRGNTVTAFYDTVGLENFPFDTATILQTTIIDPSACNIDVAAIIKLSNFFGYNSITIEAGATFEGKAGQESTVSLSDTSIYEGTVGYNAGVTLIGTQALIGGTYIGDGKNVDCSNLVNTYTQTGAYYAGNVSTFVITNNDNAAVNPDVANTIDMTDFPFAGILYIDSSGNELTDFDSFPEDHTVRIIDTTGTQKVNFGNNTGSGAHLLANTCLTTLGQIQFSLPYQYIEFSADPFDPSFLNMTYLFLT